MSDYISRQADDLISRKWLIECVEEGWIKFETEKDKNKFIHLVRDTAPSAQPEQQWISCSERLPEKPNVYTVTDSNDRVVRFVFTGTDSSREYWKRCAKAWMPLPEPYKGGE